MFQKWTVFRDAWSLIHAHVICIGRIEAVWLWCQESFFYRSINFALQANSCSYKFWLKTDYFTFLRKVIRRSCCFRRKYFERFLQGENSTWDSALEDSSDLSFLFSFTFIKSWPTSHIKSYTCFINWTVKTQLALLHSCPFIFADASKYIITKVSQILVIPNRDKYSPQRLSVKFS